MLRLEPSNNEQEDAMRCQLLALPAALAIVANPGTTPAATTLSVGKAVANATPMEPVNLGHEFGIFQKQGLDLKISDFTGGSKLIQAMTAGSIDIGIADGTGMAFTAKGAPIMAICESEAKMYPTGVGVPWDSPVHTLDGLKGKRIGISSAGSFTDFLATQLAEERGWGPNGVTKVAIGNGIDAAISGFRTHVIDADLFPTADIFEMEEKQQGRLLAVAAEFLPPTAAGAIFATNQAIASRPEAIRAFIAGWLDTIQYMRAHKAQSVEALSKLTGLSAAAMGKDYDLVVPSLSSDCRFDNESLSNLQHMFVAQKFLDAAPDMSKLYTDAFMTK
jgi:NitT/TauT family transport system substrate-binding protein